MHPGAPAEPVLAAWGITTQGSPVLLELAPGAHEGHHPWAGFLGELDACGLRVPLLVITDGDPGSSARSRWCSRSRCGRLRHTNLIERTFGETRRRIKVIGRLPGERSCLSLVWAVLDRASRGWRGLVMTPAAVRLLQELRRQLHHPGRLQEVVHQPVPPAA